MGHYDKRDVIEFDVQSWYKKRAITKIIMLYQFFILGIEFSIVYPTLPFYMEELNAPNIAFYSGLVIAASCCAAFTSGLILSRFVDVTLRFRLTVCIIILTSMIGNLIYFLAYRPFMLVIARFFVGVVEAIYPIAYGELARCYSVDEFPRHCGHFATAYVLGMAIGPSFNMVPKDKSLNFGFVVIRYTNAPGAILFCVSLLQLILSVSCLSDLSKQKQQLGITLQSLTVEKELLKSDTSCTDEWNFDDEDEKEISKDKKGQPGTSALKLSERSVCEILKQFLTKKQIVILLYGQVVWAYTLSTGLIIVPLNATKYLHLNNQQIGIAYVCGGFVLFIIMLKVSKLIPRYGPVRLSTAAFFMNLTGVFFLYLTDLAENQPFFVKALFYSLVIINFFSSCFINSPSIKCAVSRHVSLEDQSFCQSLLSFVEYFTELFGSLSLGVMVYVRLYCLVGIGINLLAIILFSTYYKALERQPKQDSYELDNVQ